MYISCIMFSGNGEIMCGFIWSFPFSIGIMQFVEKIGKKKKLKMGYLSDSMNKNIYKRILK